MSDEDETAKARAAIFDKSIEALRGLIGELHAAMGEKSDKLPSVQKAWGVIHQDDITRRKYKPIAPPYPNPENDGERFLNNVSNLRYDLAQVMRKYLTVDDAANVIFAALIETALSHSVRMWEREDARKKWAAVLYAAPGPGLKPLFDVDGTTH
jgi:hypothetical protein